MEQKEGRFTLMCPGRCCPSPKQGEQITATRDQNPASCTGEELPKIPVRFTLKKKRKFTESRHGARSGLVWESVREDK